MPGENDTKSGELPCRAKSALQTLFFWHTNIHKYALVDQRRGRLEKYDWFNHGEDG